ncbi:MAG: glutamine synthetase family protein [Chloroflexota bacterium]|nr:glutamine synthetase family protein [Chloroflexota bacterium]
MNGHGDPRDYVLRMAKDNDVRFIRLWFTDILGSLKGFAITVEELEGALDRGMDFDGSAVEGFARVDESDMVAMPDPATFSILPWRPRQNAVARVFCDITRPDGEPFEGDSRHVLKTALKRASDAGYTFMVGPEMEHFYFKSAQAPEPLDEGGYFDFTPLDTATDLRRETVLTLEEMGIPIEYSHHEAAHSQHEIDLRHTDALTMADSVMTYRQAVKDIAMRHGVYATFMPKPRADQNGNGMHVNQSLFRGDDNAFYAAADPYRLSAEAHQYIAGLLRHAPEIAIVCAQWVNSYKRLVPGFEAPTYVSWAAVNRSDLVRVPAHRPGKEESTRVEFRLPDPTCNPYLAFAAMLTAGLAGIERAYDPVPAAVEDAAKLSDAERADRGIRRLPGSLYEAIEAAEGSAILRRALGDHVCDSLLKNKRIEWEDYRSAVTDYELKRYLAIL